MKRRLLFLKNPLIFTLTASLVFSGSLETSQAAAHKSYTGKTKTVWLIPDIHCDEKAQLAVARTLQKLAETKSSPKPLLILMEGADGTIATQFFESFPDQKIRRTETLSWVKNGIISGPEYLKISKGADFPILLEGIENARLYTENFRQFRSISQKRQFLKPWFQNFTKALLKLKRKMYSPSLQKLEKLSLRLQNSQISISNYFHELIPFESLTSLSSTQLDPDSQISFFLELQTREKLFSQARLNHEFQRLIIHLSKTGQQDKLKAFYKDLVLYRLAKISERNYVRRLKKIYLEIPEDQKINYPSIAEFLALTRLKKKLDADGLRTEIQSYSEKLKESLLAEASEKKLYALSRDFDLLNKITRLEASREEFEAIQTHPEKLSPEKLTLRMKALFEASHVKEESEDSAGSPVILHLTGLYSRSIVFYETALEREKAFAENILRRMNQHQTNIAVVIAGGFHCSGIKKLLETSLIQTRTLTPRLSSLAAENYYLDLMLNLKLSRSMLSFPRLFSRLMAKLGPEFQSDVLHQLLIAYIEALQKETAETDVLKKIDQWLKIFERDLPEDFLNKSGFLMRQIILFSESISGPQGSQASKSQTILNAIQSHLKILLQTRKDWSEIAKREDLDPEPPVWFKYFAEDAEVYASLRPFAGRYAKYKQDVQLSNILEKDPLYVLFRTLQSDRPLFLKLLKLAADKKFEAYYVIEQLPFLASVLGDHPEDYRLLIELAEKIYTGDFVSSFAFQQMIAKPYFKKEDIEMAIAIADKGLDPAPLFATIDEDFRVQRPDNIQDVENLKDRFLDMLYRIHENSGSFEENQLILESTLLSLFLADPAEVAKAFKLEGSQLELWQNLRILFPYRDIPENHSFLEFLKYIPVSHLRRIFTVVLAPKLSVPSNYSGFVYLPMNLSALEEEGKPLDFADFTQEIAQSLFEEMEFDRLKIWQDIQRMRDFVENPKTADPEQVEFTSFRDFSEMYKKWFSDPDELILRANRDTIFRIHLEMMAEYFILDDGEGQKYLRFYVPQYAVDEDGEDILLKQTLGIKTPFLGLTPVDIQIKHDTGPLWPVILGAYRELMDDALDDELETAYQHFQAHGPRSDKNFSYASLDESLEIHADIDQAIQNGQAIAVNASLIDQILKTYNPEELGRLLTQDIWQIPQAARNKLSKFLSSQSYRTQIMKGLQVLKKLFESANFPIQDRRIMILLTENGPFAEGQILAHAGYQEKTSGKPETGTIYLHLQTLLLALESQELENGLSHLLKHENNDLIEKQHQLRPNSEDLAGIHRLWLALQKTIEQARFISTSQTPASAPIMIESRVKFDEAA